MSFKYLLDMIAVFSYTDYTFELIGLEDQSEKNGVEFMLIFYNVNTLIPDIEMIEMNCDAWRLHAFVTAGALNLIITGVSCNITESVLHPEGIALSVLLAVTSDSKSTKTQNNIPSSSVAVQTNYPRLAAL